MVEHGHCCIIDSASFDFWFVFFFFFRARNQPCSTFGTELFGTITFTLKGNEACCIKIRNDEDLPRFYEQLASWIAKGAKKANGFFNVPVEH